MPRFLIVVKHDDEYKGCVKALHALETHGSHFITNAEFGCSDGVHTAWLIADLDSRDEAKQIVPPECRADTQVIQLQRFTHDEIASMVKELQESS